ncbi:uroporphyrinogen-III synthase [Commensalibacter oyaizuii]|uniref:Uroporphyrinogen-III synthase n=1 Tax=Commensalibacter oyaizuii TaxID=3043873 RepID=A0ABT6PZS9_9PROT|nr:uroporphyrinogen-III synthase [Commensalibacter sp. TBRC 16381]MDI2090011.1 uroporphyrinogen-III synthase [Commensalibacter sp. TBRC 16381]
MITRPEPGLSETIAQVQALGWQVLSMPIMKIHVMPVMDVNLKATQAIIFTSRQAILPTVQQLSKQYKNWQQVPIFTVGDSTALDAQKIGFTNVYSAHKDAKALANLISQSLDFKKGSLFFPSAKGQGQGLAQDLRRFGFDIVHDEVYRTQPVGALSAQFIEKLKAKAIHTILFFSSLSAQFFCNLISEDLKKYFESIRAIGISSKVIDPLRALQWRDIHIAKDPNTQEMLSLMQEHP